MTQYILRRLLQMVPITFGILTLVDYLWPLWDDQNRAIHDMIAETRVVRS